MDNLDFILGLMKQNREAVGFIPRQGIAEYLRDGDYILQTNERGLPVGYLLHGKPAHGGLLTVAQHCIEYDQRRRGYGRETFDALLERATQANCRAIKVRCAADLPSVEFWQAMGFERTRVLRPQTTRARAIHVMLLDLWPTLWVRP